MSATLFINQARATDSNGNILPGAKLYFYDTETTTPLDVYTSSALTTPHANPVIADSGGLFPNIYLDNLETYRAILTDADDTVTVFDVDPYNGTGTVTLTGVTFDTAVNTLKVNGNTVTASAGTATVTIPNTTDTLVGRNTTDTLTNKTLTSPTVTTPTITTPTITGAPIETVYTITDGAAFEINPSNGSIQIVVLGANRTPKGTSFQNGQAMTLVVDDGTAYTLTWTDTTFGASGVKWLGNGVAGSAPTLSTTGYTWITLWKIAGQVYGNLAGVSG